MTKRINRYRRKGGFTLVEIMIVVSIIGVVAVIAIPAFARARLTSHQNSCMNNLRVIDTGKELFAMSNFSAMPSWLNLVPNYIKRMPDCPTGGMYSLNPLGADPSCSIPGHEL